MTSNPTFTILGSCVSRDPFALIENNMKIISYFARSSVISLFSGEIPVSVNDINLQSSFQKKTVYNDFTKTFSKKNLAASSDYLIIDFIDERFQLAKIHENYITRSSELVKSGLLNSYEFKLIKRDESCNGLWSRYADILIKKILQNYPPEKIILHKAKWMKTYKSKEGQLKAFPDEKTSEIKVNNDLLDYYYSYIEERIKGIKIIDFNDGTVHADESHRWGLSPFHYEHHYYEKFMGSLSSIISIVTST